MIKQSSDDHHQNGALVEKTFIPKIQSKANMQGANVELGNGNIQNPIAVGSSLRQIAAAFVAQLGTVNTGMVFGFSAIALPQLKAAGRAIISNSTLMNATSGYYSNCSITNNSMPIDDHLFTNDSMFDCKINDPGIMTIDTAQESWIASMSSIGTPIGCLLTGYMMDSLGRKRSLIVTEIPALIGWLLITFASSIDMIYAGRFLTGLSSGMVGAPARVYTSEVTQPHLRGMLTALASVGVSTGVLIEYALGGVLPWKICAAISGLIPLLALILMFFYPETPSYLISRSKPEEAKQALKKFRASSYDLDREMDGLINFSTKNNLKRLTGFGEIIRAIIKPNAIKPFTILFIYFFIYQWSGTNAVTFYAVQIFKDSGTGLNENVATVLLGMVRLLSTIAACVLCRRCGRRPLTLVSSVGCGLSMLGLGAYEWFKHENPLLGWSWIPPACIFTYTIACTLGFLVIPWVMIGEVYPIQVRGIVGGITTMAAHLFIFMVVKTFPLLKSELTQPGTYLLYGGISFFGSIYFYACLPETKNKTLQEIEDYFSGRPSNVKTGSFSCKKEKSVEDAPKS